MGRIRKLTSTQNFSPVRDVRDGIVITRDGGFVKLMEFSPINFELRSREEQRAILEANRSLWEFTEPWESPWFYAFTDLDHNGRQEVIAASTQGSGIFTYAHFYEVKADFSGIENAVAIAAGATHFAVLLADGSVRVLGDNSHGQADTAGWNLF